MPPALGSKLHDLFKRLSADSLLQGYQRELTQNQNESLNNMVWARGPKCVFCSINRLQIFLLKGCCCL